MNPPSADVGRVSEDISRRYLYTNFRDSNYLAPERSESDFVRQTLKEGYSPRTDTGFGKKECLEIDIYYSNCYQSRPSGALISVYSWLVFCIMGILTGAVAFMIEYVEEFLVDNVWEISQDLIEDDKFIPGWAVYSVFAMLFSASAALLSVYVGPGAIGSGIAEIMGYLNGVNYPGCISRLTLLVKILGVTLAVCGGLCVGKEGPLAHIGACIGVCIVYVPMKFTSYFRNDKDKRELVAAGASAGVSAAFGCPIGGALFGFEISSPASFWSFKLMWKIFFACSMATFTLNLLVAIRMGTNINFINGGLIKFGGDRNANPYNLLNIPFFFIFGWFCGIMGAGFVFLNGKVNKLRKRILKSDVAKVVETTLIALLTSTIVYFLPLLTPRCFEGNALGHQEHARQYQCENSG